MTDFEAADLIRQAAKLMDTEGWITQSLYVSVDVAARRNACLGVRKQQSGYCALGALARVARGNPFDGYDPERGSAHDRAIRALGDGTVNSVFMINDRMSKKESSPHMVQRDGIADGADRADYLRGFIEAMEGNCECGSPVEYEIAARLGCGCQKVYTYCRSCARAQWYASGLYGRACEVHKTPTQLLYHPRKLGSGHCILCPGHCPAWDTSNDQSP